MIVELKIFSSLEKNVPASPRRLDGDHWEVPEDSKVSDVLKVLNLSDNDGVILLVNGLHAKKERILSEGDVLSIYPPIGGG